MQICTNKKNKLLKKSTYGAIEGFIPPESSVIGLPDASTVFPDASTVFPDASTVFPDASVEDEEKSENVFPNIPLFPEGSVGLPEGSVELPEGSEENENVFPNIPLFPEGSVGLPEGSVELPEGSEENSENGSLNVG
jgi:hypothetical protein